MDEHKCMFCHRVVEQVDEHWYQNKATGEYVCRQCGYSAQEETPTEEHTVREQVPMAPPASAEPEPNPKDLKYFQDVLPFLLVWRQNQINQGLTSKAMSTINFESFLLKMEERLQFVKRNHLKGKKYETTIAFLDALVMGLAYFESHPFELHPDAK